MLFFEFMTKTHYPFITINLEFALPCPVVEQFQTRKLKHVHKCHVSRQSNKFYQELVEIFMFDIERFTTRYELLYLF